MVTLRSTARRPGVASSGRSSSPAKRSAAMHSDENGPSTRPALGEIKNVLSSRETGAPRRKPLTERNVPIAVSTTAQKKPMRESRSKLMSREAPKEGKSRPTRPSDLTSAKRSVGSSKMSASTSTSRQQHASKSHETEEFSHVQLPTPSSSLLSAAGVSKDISLSQQIEAAALHSSKAAPAEGRPKRFSPLIFSDDLDDLEYFDHTVLQPTQLQRADSKQPSRSDSKTSRSEAADSNSHASSDKENRPPTTARLGTASGNRQTARARVGVLTAIDTTQPTHSTPIRRARKANREVVPDSELNLDDVFLADSDRSSQMDSPGTARRAAQPTASEQLLLNYQNRGVSKVRAWKAAGHDRGDREEPRQSSPVVGQNPDAESAVSWPTADDHEEQAALHGRADADDLSSDEFGFLCAERKVRDRGATELAKPIELAGDAEGEMYLDIPTDPFDTSDDRRLAEQAFGKMSSPAPPRTQSASTVDASDAEDHVAVERQTESLAEEKGDVNIKTEKIERDAASSDDLPELDTSVRRSTRPGKKRKSDVSVAEDDDDFEAMFIPSLGGSSTQRSRGRAAKAKKAVTSVPLKRNEKQEQAILERLAAQESSSAASSSPPASPYAAKKSRASATRTSAKKFRMDDALTFLPPRKNKATSAAKGKKAGKGQGGKSTRSTKSKTSNNGKGKRAGDPYILVEDSDAPSASKTKKAKKKASTAASKKGKGRATKQTDVDDDDEDEEGDEDDEDWRLNSDDSERTRRMKQIRAVDDYELECEVVL